MNINNEKNHHKPEISESSSDNENFPNQMNSIDTSQINPNDNSRTSIIKKEVQIILNPDNISPIVPSQKPKTKSKKKSSKKRKLDETREKESLSNTIDNTGESNTRYTMVHNESPDKKHLDNSYEDSFFDGIIDDETYNKFFQITLSYFSEKIGEKIKKLTNNIKRQASDTIIKELKKIYDSKDLTNQVIKNTQNNEQDQPCWKKICCCFKKKEKLKLKNDYDMRESSTSICRYMYSFAKDEIEDFSEKNIEQFCNINDEEAKLFSNEKATLFCSKRGMEERLRLESENYANYFNVEKIIDKQKNTLDTQEKKKDEINLIKEQNVCLFCMENQRNILFLPCYHLIYCGKCSENIKDDKCPECKVHIDNKIKTD